MDYGYALVVVLLTLPLIYYFNKRFMRFNDFLQLKNVSCRKDKYETNILTVTYNCAYK
ncbi:hypothetical protein GCM10008934_14070 [Virgibacillus salarius]